MGPPHIPSRFIGPNTQSVRGHKQPVIISLIRRRGDIWTVSGGKDYAGKPRPVVIVQDDSFDATSSVTVCTFTTDETDAPLIRLPIQPNERNGLRSPSRVMVDKITTVPKSKLRARVGKLDDEDIVRLNQAILVFLGLAVSPRLKPEA